MQPILDASLVSEELRDESLNYLFQLIPLTLFCLDKSRNYDHLSSSPG